ncbi:MAG: GAF domain-containing protein [Chloroflexota bacterium]|nr:GAF domain-containing protein [Chloroflexota bacterium]
MTSLFDRLLAPYRQSNMTEIQYWRERIINAVLIVTSITGGIAYIINLIPALKAGSSSTAIIYTLIYGSMLVVTVIRRIPFVARVGTFLAALYFAGIASALAYGSAGDVRIWLIGVSLLTTVFFGARAGIIASVFNTGTLLLIGLLMNQHLIQAPDIREYVDLTKMFPWTSTSVPFLVVSILAAISFSVIINSLKTNLQKANKLSTDLEHERVQLQNRAQDLERRETQIRTAAEISHAISVELDTEKIFHQIVTLVKERFNLYYVGVFMLDDQGLFAILKIGSGEAGQKMVADGHKLAVGGASMIGWATSHRQARIALDTGKEAVRFQNPYLPLTRSELALPIISKDRVLGAMTVQSKRPDAFDENDIIVLQGIANSLATAIDHARLLDQTKESLQEVQGLHRQYLTGAWDDVIAREDELSYSVEDATKFIEGDPTIIEVPLILRDQIIGAITVERGEETWSPQDEAFLENIALQAALALENARLVEHTQRNAQYNRTIAEITRQIWTSTDVDTILRTSLQELGQTLQASDGLIQLNVSGDQEEA